MKTLIILLTAVSALTSSLAQPVMTNGFTHVDFDGDSKVEAVLNWGGDQRGTMPEDWFVGCSLEPSGESRILKATSSRIAFGFNEPVDASRSVYVKSANPNLLLIFGRALSFDGGVTWQYQTLTPGFEKESEVLLGLKLALPTGAHYGWIKLTRPIVDLYTPFTVAAYAYHPVPGAAIGAGEAPSPPPLQWSVGNDGSLNFTWDTALGEAVLEWTDALDHPNWQPVPDASAPPVMLLPGEGQRFYRLRRP